MPAALALAPLPPDPELDAEVEAHLVATDGLMLAPAMCDVEGALRMDMGVLQCLGLGARWAKWHDALQLHG
jgi:hypothetical protein